MKIFGRSRIFSGTTGFSPWGSIFNALAADKKHTPGEKQRWERVESAQAKELQTTPMSLRLKQLRWLMDSFPAARNKAQDEKKINAVRGHWLKLKAA